MKRLILPFLFALTLAGCLSRSQPEITSFLIQAPDLHIAALASPYTVKVLPIHVAAPYADKSFIYRLNEERYEADFYHQFLAQPKQMLAQAITAGLSQGRLFKTVLPANNVQEGDLLLEITATELYADYRQQPQAVLTLQAYLSRADQDNGSYLLNETIAIRVPMASKSAANYAGALNQALAQALTQLQDKMAQRLGRAL